MITLQLGEKSFAVQEFRFVHLKQAAPIMDRIAKRTLSAPERGGTTNINHNWSLSALDARSVKGLLNSSRGQAMVHGFTKGK